MNFLGDLSEQSSIFWEVILKNNKNSELRKENINEITNHSKDWS